MNTDTRVKHISALVYLLEDLTRELYAETSEPQVEAFLSDVCKVRTHIEDWSDDE